MPTYPRAAYPLGAIDLEYFGAPEALAVHHADRERGTIVSHAWDETRNFGHQHCCSQQFDLPLMVSLEGTAGASTRRIHAL